MAYGIRGAAIAWAIRLGLETIVLFGFTQSLLPITAPYNRHTALSLVPALTALIIAGFIDGAIMKGLFLMVMLSTSVLWGWFSLTDEDRIFIKEIVSNNLTLTRGNKQ